MSQVQTFYANSIDQMVDVGQAIAKQLSFPSCVYLTGNLGAGKTTLVKSIIRHFGYQGIVTSPTYNLIQNYPIGIHEIYHMDLYRLESPEELEFLAIRDLYQDNSMLLIEWPEQAAGHLLAPSHNLKIETNNNMSRVITFSSHS